MDKTELKELLQGCSKPIAEVLPEQMKNPKYSIIVYPYTFGQFRIQLTNASKPDTGAPKGHGRIVREMCTYKFPTCLTVMARLIEAEDPEEVPKGWCVYPDPEDETKPFNEQKKWNCEYPGGRIRLDSVPIPEIDL